MGSQGRRRGRRTRSDRPGSRRTTEAGIDFSSARYSAFTPMGTVERVGTFARGAFRSRSSRRRQAVARIVVIGFLVFTIAMMVLGLVQSIRA